MMRGWEILAVVFILLASACGDGVTTDNSATAIDSIAALPEYRELDSLTRLLDKSPENPDLLNQRAKVFIRAGELNFALADVGRAILIDSSKADYFLTISDIYFQRQEPKRCLKALEMARHLDPRNLDAMQRLAQFKLYLGAYQESIDLANQMLAIESQDERPFIIKALCFKELKDTTKAIDSYLMAVAQNPDNYDVQMELGILHWGKGEAVAESYLKNALDIRPDSKQALYALGMVYQTTDRPDEALAAYAQILELDSTYRDAHYNTGYVLFTEARYTEALESFDRAVAVSPGYHQAVYMRGLCHEMSGEKELAKREYSYALQLAPNFQKANDRLQGLLKKR
jgi:tetratricopeptide (TPR) repeat protein